MQNLPAFIETLNSISGKSSAHRLSTYVRPDVTFHDPQLDASGRDGLTAAITHIFAAADPNSPQSGRIRVLDCAVGQLGQAVYLRWDRLINLEGGKRVSYSGMSEIMYGQDGLITSITDYYDPADAPVAKSTSLWSRISGR